jgi:hypothetical protein
MCETQLPISTCWNWLSPLHIQHLRPQSSSSVIGWVTAHIAKDHNASSGLSRPWRLAILLGLFGPEDEGTIILKNVMNYLPNTASHSITLASIEDPSTRTKSQSWQLHTPWDRNMWCSQPGMHTLNHHKTIQAEATNGNKLKLHHTVTSPHILCLI